MISDEYKALFTHIDKTGGSSITSMLNNGGREETKYKHKPMADMIDSSNKDYFKFAFVRNPYERILSKYYHDVKIARPEKPGSTRNTTNFREWVNRHKNGLRKFLRPQYEYLHDKSGKLLPDFVGKFENFEKDLLYVKEKLGLKSEILHKNQNPIKKDVNTMLDYNRESLDVVNKLYSKDFKAFNYEML